MNENNDAVLGAIERVSKYLTERVAMKGLHQEEISGLHAGDDREANIFASDLRLMIAAHAAQSEALASQALRVAELAAELSNIANAKLSDFDDAESFRDWARNRARHTLAKAEVVQPAKQPGTGNRIATAEDIASDEAAREAETARLAKQYVDRTTPAAAPVDTCAEMRALCSACGGTGDVHGIDGEWRGSCDCAASAWSRPAAAIAAARPSAPQGWISVDERLPEVDVTVLVYAPPQVGDWPDSIRISFDCIDPNDDDHATWLSHNEHYEHYCCVAKPEGSTGPSEKAPYTHWMPLPLPPAPDRSAP